MHNRTLPKLLQQLQYGSLNCTGVARQIELERNLAHVFRELFSVIIQRLTWIIVGVQKFFLISLFQFFTSFRILRTIKFRKLDGWKRFDDKGFNDIVIRVLGNLVNDCNRADYIDRLAAD